MLRYISIAMLIFGCAGVLVLMARKNVNSGRTSLRDSYDNEKYKISEAGSESEISSVSRVVNGRGFEPVRLSPVPMLEESRAELRKSAPSGNDREQEARRLASEKNQVMDELLARPDIPSDYGAEMVALSRDRTQDVYTRDFAVQRVMAVQLCGERGIAASRPLLRRLVADTATPAPLKMAAEWSLQALDGKVVSQ